MLLKNESRIKHSNAATALSIYLFLIHRPLIQGIFNLEDAHALQISIFELRQV